MQARKHHDLDYQLFLLREQSNSDSAPCETPTPVSGRRTPPRGYKEVAATITESYQRKRNCWWSRKATPTPTMDSKTVAAEEVEDSDPEVLATLTALLYADEQK